MGKKGDISKEKLTQAILGLYPNNAFVVDKNIYINFVESGDKVQLKIGLTMPKSAIDPSETMEPAGDYNWGETATTETPSPAPTAEITPEERQHLTDLLSRLGL